MGAARRGVNRLSMPMFLRVFAVMVLVVGASSFVFGNVVGLYQNRASADTLAGLWAEAIRATAARDPAVVATQRVEISVDLRRGEPPSSAYELTSDPRMASLTDALSVRGIEVSQVRLDDSTDPPVTWLRLQERGGTSRWLGIVGGPQPSAYLRRLLLAFAVLAVLVLAIAALASRWIASPLSRLVRQVDVIARGEVPATRVRGAREIERLDTALRSMAQRRADDDELRRTMLLGISHDLRSPLARIRVAAELLDDEAAGVALRELIVRNVGQADAIIESFLTYVRAEAHAPLDEIDLAQVARVAAELAQLPPAQTQVGATALVHGDPILLQRVVANLIDNARRHGAEPVALSVAVDGAAGLARLNVSDAGRGIDDPDRSRRAFERGDPGRSGQGSGLGLAIVDRIVERHGGLVEIGRGRDGGASVTVLLPLAGAGRIGQAGEVRPALARTGPPT